MLTYFSPSSLFLIWCDWVSGSVTLHIFCDLSIRNPLLNPLDSSSRANQNSFRVWQLNLTVPGRIQFYETTKLFKELLPFHLLLYCPPHPNMWCQLFPANCLIRHPVLKSKNWWEESQQCIFILLSMNNLL